MTAPSSRFEDEGIPDPGDLTTEQAMTGQDELTSEPPHDFPIAVDDFGTTAAEQREGESLTGRLERELPDVTQALDTDAVGRLVEPDEGARTDVDKELVATDVGVDLGGLTAEEAAMHLEPEPGELEI